MQFSLSEPDAIFLANRLLIRGFYSFSMDMIWSCFEGSWKNWQSTEGDKQQEAWLECMIFRLTTADLSEKHQQKLVGSGQIMLHICTRRQNKPVSNLSIRHQSIYSWMMLLILFLMNIWYNKCLIFLERTIFGNYNAYSSFIWYIVNCRWLWICYKSDWC